MWTAELRWLQSHIPGECQTHGGAVAKSLVRTWDPGERSQVVVKFACRTDRKFYLLGVRKNSGFGQQAVECILCAVLYCVNTLELCFKYGET